jgi:hypothetical protein
MRIAHRGIVQAATGESAAKSIMNKVVSGYVAVIITLSCTTLTAAMVASPHPGGAAVGILAGMGWMAVLSDMNTTYFLSWLADEPEIVYMA